MNISHRTEEGVCIVALKGNFALEEASAVKNYLKPLIQDEKTRRLIINLTEVDFIDSSGMGVIVTTFKGLRDRKAQLKLCGLNKGAQEVFEMTKLDEIVDIHETEEDALSAE